MSISAQMEQIGETPSLPGGSVVWFAGKTFTEPGLYVWDGERNVRVVTLAALVIAMSDPDATEDTPQGVNPDYLAAAIGYGIDLQEATDIVDLAFAGREKLSTFQRQLYDEALGVTEDE